MNLLWWITLTIRLTAARLIPIHDTQALSAARKTMALINGLRRALPWDLISEVNQFGDTILYSDWMRLQDSFRETPGTRTFLLYVGACKRQGRLMRRTPFTYYPIHLTTSWNIISLDFPNQKLGDCAIGNLRRLPPTLKRLNLGLCDLTRFEVSKLPEGLRELDLSNNFLTDLELTKLPSALQTLYAGFNYLHSANLTSLPPGMKFLVMVDNEITDVETNVLPSGLKLLDLRENRLQDFHFRRIAGGGSNALAIEGEHDQKE